MYTVIDVSKYNTITDYQKAGNAVDGVIIRAGYRGYGSSGTLQTDSKFEENYANFFNYTKVGVYWFTQAITTAEAVEEANYLYSLIKGKNISFPIYLDSEYANTQHTGRADSLSAEDRTKLIISFLSRMKELGYKAGVYASDSWFKSNLVYSSLLEQEYSIWVARYSSITPTISTYDGWQYTSSGSISGISGNVDISHFYKDVAGWDYVRPVYDYIIGLDCVLYDYDGTEKEPAVLTRSLTEDVDYTVEYQNNINAGIAAAIVTGINSYEGTYSYQFVISPIELKGECIIADETTWEYTGEEITPTVSVGDLVKNTDFTVSYQNNINVGTATGIATGINNYDGTKSATFTIVSTSLDDGERKISIPRDTYKYTGAEIKPTVTIDDLVEGTDFYVTYSDNINVGTATIVAKGMGNYKDSLERTFKIDNYDLSEHEIVLDPTSFVYTGSNCIPDASIPDLDVSYYQITLPTEAIEIGTYTVSATGLGEFAGTSTSTTYNINGRSISSLTPVLEYYVHNYVADYLEPKVTIEGLTEGTDFRVEYTDNYDVGTARATIFGINNYTGSTYAEFDIIESKITNCIGKFGKPSYRTPYRIYDGNDFELYAGEAMYNQGKSMTIDYDYVITKTDISLKENFYLYSFYVKGLYSFSGSAIFRFRILMEEPSDPIDEKDDGVYNFGDVDEGDETAVGDYDFGDKDEGISEETVVVDGQNYDFEIYSQIYLSDYDVDDGLNVDANGLTPDESGKGSDKDDDGKFNFGDIDLGDESAVGDYDFGDLDEGTSEETVAVDDYDFNILSGDKEEGYAAGTEFELNNTAVYSLYSSKKVSFYASGTYFIYKSTVCNNRIRITKYDDGVEEPVRATGWVSMDDLENLDKIAVGDAVIVNGLMYQYANGYGGYTSKNNELMYVVSYDENYQNPYGLASSLVNTRQGFASAASLTKIKE